MATESQPIDIDDESDVVDLCDKSSEDDDDSVVDLTAASPASPKRRRSVIDIEDEAVARQLEQEEQRPSPPPSPRSRASSGRGASPSLIKPPSAEAKARLRKDAARMGWPPPAP